MLRFDMMRHTRKFSVCLCRSDFSRLIELQLATKTKRQIKIRRSIYVQKSKSLKLDVNSLPQ
jgi:hypothetical protein